MALAPLSLRLGRSTLTLVHGVNGSGKTTLLRVLGGLLTPSSGTRVGHGAALYLRSGDGARRAQRVDQAVRFAVCLGSPLARVEDVVRATGLETVMGRRVATLSSGQRARVTLAVGLAVSPALLCLDEPAAHLDEEGIGFLRQVVDLLRERGSAVVVASQTATSGLLAGADACLVLDGGRLVGRA